MPRNQIIKSGVNIKQRYLCKNASTFLRLIKLAKKIDDYYVTKALNVSEGLSYREIEHYNRGFTCYHQLGEIFNIKSKSCKLPSTYKIFNHLELIEYIKNKELLSGAGMIIADSLVMLIKWERFKD
jgi:hypothetical protein